MKRFLTLLLALFSLPAFAAFAVVESVITGNTASGTSHTVAYHTTGESPYSNGDLLVLIFANDGSSATSTPPAGQWLTNQLYSESANSHGAMVSWFESDGTENDTTFSVTTTASEGSAWFLFHISGWHGTSAPEVGTRVSEGGTDWPSVTLTPVGWTTAEDTLWIVYITNDNSQDQITLYPTETPDNRTYSGQNGTDVAGVAIATDNENATSFTTTEVTGARSGTTGARTAVIGIRPAAGGGGGTSIPIIMHHRRQQEN